jgi:hypothetical protein
MKPETVKQNLQFLYAELERIEKTYCPERKIYLLEEIDYQELQLLKIKTQEYYKETKDENS